MARPQETYAKAVRLSELLSRFHKAQSHGEPAADPTRGQGRVIAALKLRDELSSKDLAFLLGIRAQSLNELLQKLERSGYVERIQDEDDRRVMLVRLTEAGRAIDLESVDYDDAFTALSEEEHADFDAFLDRLNEDLAARVPQRSGGEGHGGKKHRDHHMEGGQDMKGNSKGKCHRHGKNGGGKGKGKGKEGKDKKGC